MNLKIYAVKKGNTYFTYHFFQGDTLLNDAGLLENNTRDELIRQEVLQEQATNSSNMGDQLQQDLTAELITLRGWNESAHEVIIN